MDRTSLAVHLDLDPVPGPMNTEESVKENVQRLLDQRLSSYNPSVFLLAELPPIYVTSKSGNPASAGQYGPFMIYLGPSFHDAVEAVGEFQKYEDPVKAKGREQFSVLPVAMKRETVRFYGIDEFWFHVEKIEL